MVHLDPFDGEMVDPGHAAAVIAPPYDRLSADERRAIAATRPDSFLTVLPTGTTDDDDGDDGLRANRAALQALRRRGRFAPLPGPCLAVLALGDDAQTAVAIVGDVEVAAFESGAIRSHEQVRPARVEQLARYLEVVGTASSPVALVHRDDPHIDAVTAAVMRRADPDLDVVLDDGVRLRVWLVVAAAHQDELRETFAGAQGLTIADGHHRAAAGAAFAAAHGPGRVVERILVAAFPASRLTVSAFDRRISGLGPDAGTRILTILGTAGIEPTPIEPPTSRPPRHVAHLGVEQRWWAVPLDDVLRTDPLGQIDAAVIERVLLEPLTKRVASVVVEPVPAAPTGTGHPPPDPGPGTALVRLHPPDVDALITVAAAGATLPAKSTYLGPKLRSGVFLVPRRRG
jgi:uncharacterized protein (DUF1015 family)